MKENPSTPKISVIINCFNGEKFLRETLESLFHQTFCDFELVFWDNRSTDQSAKILGQFEDPRTRYFLAPDFTTLGEARNLALRHARGTWTAFLDCDDIWKSTKLAEQMGVVDQDSDPNQIGLVYTRTLCLGGPRDGLEIQPELTSKPLPEGRIIKEYLHRENFIALSSAMMRTQILREIGGIPAHFRQSEDFYIFAKIASRSIVRAVNATLTLYRVHSNNLTITQQYEGYAEQKATIEACIRDLPELGATPSIQAKSARLSVYACWFAIIKKHSLTLAVKHAIKPSLWRFAGALRQEIGTRWTRALKQSKAIP